MVVVRAVSGTTVFTAVWGEGSGVIASIVSSTTCADKSNVLKYDYAYIVLFSKIL